MFVVYWLEQGTSQTATARFERFAGDAMTEALAFTETLRKKQAAGYSLA